MSNFCPDTGGWRWSLVRVRLFSCAAGREGHCRQISLACVGSTRSVPATLGLPPLTAHVLHCSGSRLLSKERALSCMHFPGLSHSGSGFWVLHKDADSVGPAFCAFPVQQLRQPGACECTLPGCVRRTPPRSQPQFLGALVWCALCLFWGADFWL